jgi:hypothetical protein
MMRRIRIYNGSQFSSEHIFLDHNALLLTLELRGPPVLECLLKFRTRNNNPSRCFRYKANSSHKQ